MSIIARSAKLGVLLACATSLAACAGVRAHRGYILDKELASAIQVGVDNKDSVAKTLGRPSFTSQFGDNDWYYVSRDTSALAFRNPHVTDQTVLHVHFNPAGAVDQVNQTGKELVASIDPVNAKTPTLGKKKGFFSELFGNIGTVGSGLTPSQPKQ